MRYVIVFLFATNFSLPVEAQLFGPDAVTSTVKPDAKASGTRRQQEWLRATLDDRVRISEKLGEEGGEAWARAHGWKPLLISGEKSIPQGPDSVWLAPDGTICVLEYKGGSSPLGRGYGYEQGTAEWAVESAKRILHSTRTSTAEKAAAEKILQAAVEHKLVVDIVRTDHVLGEPIAAVLEKSSATSESAARLAQQAIDEIGLLGKDGVMASEALAASSEGIAIAAGRSAGGKVLGAVGKAALPVAVGLDVGIRVSEATDVEHRFSTGQIGQEQRELEHAENASGFVGGWGGATAGGALGAEGGAVLGPIGAAVGGAVGGVAGYFGGEATLKAGTRWVVSRVHAAGWTLAGIVRDGWLWTTKHAWIVGGMVGDFAHGTWCWTAHVTGTAWVWTSGATCTAWNWSCDRVCDAGTVIGHAAKNAWTWTVSWF